MSTKDNLADAFAGESQANRKYLAFAQKAEQEGFPQVAKLFRAAAAAQTVHAHAHLRALGGIKATGDNLQAAIDGETFEYTEMYPPMLKQAEAETLRKTCRRPLMIHLIKSNGIKTESGWHLLSPTLRRI